MKFSGKVKVISKKTLSDDVFQIKVEKHQAMGEIKPGQFFNIVASKTGYPLLRRPISVSGFDDETVEFTIKVIGSGTLALSGLCTGDEIDIMGPLGNGFDLEYDSFGYGKVLLVGGGIGVAPIKGLAEKLSSQGVKMDVIIGFRDKPYLVEAFSQLHARMTIVSENDTAFTLGYVTKPFEAYVNHEKYNMIFACGPEVMLRTVAGIAESRNIEIQLLMEEKMACGIGACLVCTCKTKEGAFGFKHSRMCKDGPMFYGREVIFDEA